MRSRHAAMLAGCEWADTPAQMKRITRDTKQARPPRYRSAAGDEYRHARKDIEGIAREMHHRPMWDVQGDMLIRMALQRHAFSSMKFPLPHATPQAGTAYLLHSEKRYINVLMECLIDSRLPSPQAPRFLMNDIIDELIACAMNNHTNKLSISLKFKLNCQTN